MCGVTISFWISSPESEDNDRPKPKPRPRPRPNPDLPGQKAGKGQQKAKPGTTKGKATVAPQKKQNPSKPAKAKASQPMPEPSSQSGFSSYPVVVKCLNKKTNENTLFYNFKQFGKIMPDGVTILKHDGVSKCIGYVNYEDSMSPQKAISQMNGKTIDGNVIQVENYVLKTARSQSTSSNAPEKEDYRPITDCSFFMEGKCSKPSCPYRHPKNLKANVCKSWEGDTCKNISCPFLHPPKVKGTLRPKGSTTSQPSNNPITLKVNTPVEVTIHSKQYRGIVRWCGFIEEMNNSMAGIELEVPVDGGCNGIFQGRKYFICDEKRGYFVVSSQCKKLSTSNIAMATSAKIKTEYICGFYLKNRCTNGESCSAIHPPYMLSYCWYYRIQGESEVSVCPKGITKAVEKQYRDVNSTDFSQDPYCINFEIASYSKYKGLNTDFKRVSTPSTVSCKASGEPLATGWKWYWFDDSSWVEYNLEYNFPGQVSSEIIETEYEKFQQKNDLKPMKFYTKEFHYTLDFKTMLQKNLHTDKQRHVRRRPAPFPEKRERSLAPPTDNFPSHWTSAPVIGYSAIPVKNDVLSKIERDFAQTMGGRMNYRIISVGEICNKQLYRQYTIKKKNMEESNSGQVKEMQLWHGTDNDIVEKICQQNFDWRMVKTHAYGKGSYFARDASYSNSFTNGATSNICSMFYADVLVGQYCRGLSDYNRPPERTKNVLYDSCVDNVSNPSIYVIFERDQFYPRYLIKYTRTL
ncbi:protein mono-ADP-ribosyltransferase PARP12-like isoform X2 [Clytia hemisphaerica]|uniref:protein mono-ADP-ribosyltransferase PARP12-like isoform X2 n=1 Tax=Clytia hemisphaerica TaxID=252671 RepID=UPI0034D67E9E|eukprot:TCONS_00012532-protein